MVSELGGVTYARFFPSDWRTGCIDLNLEEEGLYMRCCMFMYDTGQPIPGDDSTAARMLRVQINKYTKVMNALLAKGKMMRAQGVIINERVLREIDEYRQTKSAREIAAKKREQIKRELERQKARNATPNPMANPLANPLANPTPYPGANPGGNPGGMPGGSLGGNPPGTPQDGHGVHPKNINDFNGTASDDCSQDTSRLAQGMPYARATPLPLPSPLPSPESKNHTHTHTSAAAPAGGGAGIGDVDDETEKLDPDLRRAADILAPIFGSASEPDFDAAYRCVSDFAQSSIYTLEDVVNAAMDVGSHKSRGDARAWTVTPRSFGNWVRQAKKDRTQSEASSIHSEKAPAPVRRIPPGEFAPGFVMGEDGRVTLINGKRAEWLERFGDNATLLDMTLIAASNNIKPNSPTPPPAQVEAQLARACRDIVLRGENAKKAAQARYDAEFGIAAKPTKTETDHERTERLIEEALRNG